MLVCVDKVGTTKNELEELDRTSPYNVVAGFVQCITDYDPKDPKEFYNKLQFLLGDMQPLSEIMKQNIEDRMRQNNKYTYIGKSYFVGATPQNNYTPNDDPYQIEITENPYSNIQEGMLKLFVKSGGADSPRGIVIRLGKDRNYYIWSDSFMGLLADIRPMESTNPWA